MTALATLLGAAGCAGTTGPGPTVPPEGVVKVDDGTRRETTNAWHRNYNPEVVAVQAEPRASTVAEPAAAAAPAAATAAAMGGMCEGQPTDPPQVAGVGQCYAKLWNEPQYSDVVQRTMVKPAGTRIEVVPAQYQTVTEEVMVREARKETRVIPAEYETVKDRVLVRPAYTRVETTPAVYDIYEEQQLVKPAYKTWKPGTMTAIQRVDESGQILCLVEVPAEYKTVTRRELRTAEQTRNIEVPAEYTEVEKSVVKTAERTEVVEVEPAVYETRQIEKLVQPAKETTVATEAEYADVTTKQLAAAGCYAWRQVLCDTNMTQDTVVSVQKKLSELGYYAGEPTGEFDEATLAAVNEYEQDNDLPVDPYLSVETARSLGIEAD
jgi:hypothetical protein